jgi:hypothetical protein
VNLLPNNRSSSAYGAYRCESGTGTINSVVNIRRFGRRLNCRCGQEGVSSRQQIDP